jgi:hypothetical protein
MGTILHKSQEMFQNLVFTELPVLVPRGMSQLDFEQELLFVHTHLPDIEEAQLYMQLVSPYTRYYTDAIGVKFDEKTNTILVYKDERIGIEPKSADIGDSTTIVPVSPLAHYLTINHQGYSF